MTDEERREKKRKANEAIEDAMTYRMSLNENYEGEIITDWVIVYVAEDPAEHRVAHGLFYPRGRLQVHKVLGLLELAKSQSLDRYKQTRRDDND